MNSDVILGIAIGILPTFFINVGSHMANYLLLRKLQKKDHVDNLSASAQSDRESFRFSMLSETQFKCYNDTWIGLCAIEDAMEELWSEGASRETIQHLVKVLRKFDDKFRQSALLFESDDFRDLSRMLESVKDYRVGKEKLLELDDIDDAASREIQRQIDANFELLRQYQSLKLRLLQKFRVRLGL